MSTYRDEPGIVVNELMEVVTESKAVGEVLQTFNAALNAADPGDGLGERLYGGDVAYQHVDPALLANLNNAAIPVVRALGEVRRELDHKARRLANELAATTWARNADK